jgi:hypothetical protein
MMGRFDVQVSDLGLLAEFPELFKGRLHKGERKGLAALMRGQVDRIRTLKPELPAGI